MRKFKGFVNRTICGAAGIGMLVFGAMIDSESYLPAIMCGVCAVIFLLYGIANGWVE